MSNIIEGIWLNPATGLNEARQIKATEDGYLLVSGSGGGGGSSADRELSIVTYRATSAFTGAAVGDVITATRVLDLTGATPVVEGATIWRNETQSTALASAPAAGNIAIVGADALTDDQLGVRIGGQSDAAAPADGTGSYSLFAAIKRNLQNWAALITWLPAKGSATAANSIPVVLSSDGPFSTGFGAQADAAATSDTGAFSLIALIKRSLQNGSTLVGRVPAAVTPGLLPVDSLGTPSTPRVQATSGTAAAITLTATCRRVSMYATTGTWYSISGTATATSHYIGAGERLDFDVPASTVISVLQESSAGSVRVSELV